MKKLILLFTFLLGASTLLLASGTDSSGVNLNTPTDNEDQTLLGKGSPVGFFLGWNNKPAIINQQTAFMTGGQLSLVFGHKLNVGLAGYGLLTPVLSDRIDADGTRYFYDMGYGGCMIEPVFFSRSAVHFTMPVLLGAGGVGFRPTTTPFNYDYDSVDWDNYYADAFFVVEPGLNLELNLFKWLRMDAGISYRFISDGFMGSPVSAELSGWSGSLGLKLGWF